MGISCSQKDLYLQNIDIKENEECTAIKSVYSELYYTVKL